MYLQLLFFRLNGKLLFQNFCNYLKYFGHIFLHGKQEESPQFCLSIIPTCCSSSSSEAFNSIVLTHIDQNTIRNSKYLWYESMRMSVHGKEPLLLSHMTLSAFSVSDPCWSRAVLQRVCCSQRTALAWHWLHSVPYGELNHHLLSRAIWLPWPFFGFSANCSV